MQCKVCLNVFRIFLYCSSFRFYCLQVRLIAPVGSQGYGLFVSSSMYAALGFYGIRISAIVSTKSNTAVSMRRFIFYCRSSDHVVSFESLACLLFSFKCLHASSVKSEMVFIVSSSSFEFCNWGLISIVSFLSPVCC